MIRAEIELGGQLQVLKLDTENKSEAIEKIWNTFGYTTYIINLETIAREVVNETGINSTTDSDEHQ